MFSGLERTWSVLLMRNRIMKRSLRVPVRTAHLVHEQDGLGDLHHRGPGVRRGLLKPTEGLRLERPS